MKAKPDTIAVKDLLELRKQQMLVVNAEYQRGVVWSATQKKQLVDSVLRGYPLPLIYLHFIQQKAGPLISQRYEVIDGLPKGDAAPLDAAAEGSEASLRLDRARDHLLP